MKNLGVVFVLLLLLAAATAAAQTFIRGDVALQTKGDPSMNAWLFRPGPWTCCAWHLGGAALIYKIVPFVGSGRLFVPAPSVILFHDGHTVSGWDGVYEYFELPGKGYNDIFTDDAELTEIAPIRSGHFLVAEARSDRGAKLIEFDLHGKIAEIPFEGADHIELLADQCTLLYTNGDPRVRRFNLCTQRQETDFATLQPYESAHSGRKPTSRSCSRTSPPDRSGRCRTATCSWLHANRLCTFVIRRSGRGPRFRA